MKKEFQIVAKGHNVTYEIVNSLKLTRGATDVKDGHVSENGAARDSPHFWHFCLKTVGEDWSVLILD
jgi:hypothetical protein